MNKSARACRPMQRLSKATLLAILNSSPDYSQAIVVETGNIIDISNVDQRTINKNIKDKLWVYYENNEARRVLLVNPNWSITSFNPYKREICVNLENDSGTRLLSYTVPEYYYFG